MWSGSHFKEVTLDWLVTEGGSLRREGRYSYMCAADIHRCHNLIYKNHFHIPMGRPIRELVTFGIYLMMQNRPDNQHGQTHQSPSYHAQG